MDKEANIFDVHAQTYHRVRPGYPKEVYDFVAQYKALGNASTILEIGAGQGLATEEIAQYWHPHIDDLEPGTNLVHLLKTRMADYQNIQIYESGFEEYHGGGKRYDAIFSATAFHWIEKDVKYTKSYALLKPGGILVVYWNNYGIYRIRLLGKKYVTYIERMDLYEKTVKQQKNTRRTTLKKERMKSLKVDCSRSFTMKKLYTIWNMQQNSISDS